MYIISHSALSVRVFSVLPLDSSSSWDQLPNISTTRSTRHLQKVHSLYVTELHYLLSGHRTFSFTQNRRTECCYLIPFPCRFSINSLKSNFYLHYLRDFYGIYILFLFPLERMSPNIQSVQNVLTYIDRAPHWVPEMSRYSTSSSVSIFALGCKPLLCFVLWAPPMLKEYSASSF